MGDLCGSPRGRRLDVGPPSGFPNSHAWIKATNLGRGQWLQTSAGTYVQITALQRWTQQATVNNLTITDLHTYYVLAGETPLLVHNSNKFCGPDADALQEWDRAKFKSVEESATYHLDKHGKGRTFAEYTKEARNLWKKADPKDRVPWKLQQWGHGLED